MGNKAYIRDKRVLGKQYEKELRKNATYAERHFRKLLNLLKKQYHLKIDVKFQKGWYEQEAFFISDFYFPASKTTIELDGIQHAVKRFADKDAVKTAYLRRIGINTIRIANIDVKLMDSEALLRFLVRNSVI